MQQNRHKSRWNGIDLLHKLAELPLEAVHWMKAKAQTALLEKKLLEPARSIRLQDEAKAMLGKRLQRLDQLAGWQKPSGSGSSGNWSASGFPGGLGVNPSGAELALLESIRKERDRCNRNNVTRTAAYWEMYRKHPELHWALLAHMVSRNGGWFMTDLQGELLPFLLSPEQREQVFRFLERSNALIFHDAYPQLLLYSASVKARLPLFHLLPQLDVSRFMRPVWDCFWERRDSALLTTGLIVNEQHFIESRVVRHPDFRHKVLDTLFFQTQSLLQLNQVVFPFADEGRTRLAGVILDNFSSLRERIEAGKTLYAILFGIPAVAEGALRFAQITRHSGSRADYWPHLFAAVRKQPPVPRGQLQERLDGCKLRPGAAPLYSPRLSDSWADRRVAPAEPGDWYEGAKALGYFSDIRAPFAFEMTGEFCFGLNKIEMAVLAGDLLV
ncbi:hypothetical protein PAESOLCIP111_01918 [Paenibacillus solanacearum]|uniref:DUF2515 domain-containing protein n=1 Tax=Paenibacillus solanacearum TaxID=2048548 RepID=A0A916NP15_9BACL|nr:DUF2515 domain-containing protein [Paenibacillus solanacearum]CAG7616557.1 hypothetical protein PAESOLCIP111_01918 [Paenibacillus solanacearum]